MLNNMTAPQTLRLGLTCDQRNNASSPRDKSALLFPRGNASSSPLSLLSGGVRRTQAAVESIPEAELLLGSSSIQGDLDDAESAPAKKSFVFGLVLCFCSGVFSPMLNVGIAFGDKIEDASSASGASDSMKKNLLWALVVTGGFLANGIYSIYLMQTQKTWGNFYTGTTGQVVHDLLLSIFMGFLWISGNVVYGIGATMMGSLGTVAGWPIFMVSMVLTATVVSMVAGDYKGTSNTTVLLLCVGLTILLAATIVVALGS
eukprot:m.433426 g.433426  ORF g.433426 m.433426 type:complete len:259 (-) comp21417_c2_seq3:485-1261(-)